MKTIKSLLFILVSFLMFTNLSAQTTLTVKLPNKDSLMNQVSNEVTSKLNTMSMDTLLNDIKGFVPDSTLPFYKEVYGDLKAGAMSIANGLGVAVKELFTILCIQQVVKSIVNMVVLLSMLLLAFWANKVWKNTEFTSDGPNGQGVLFCVIGVICLIMFLFTLFNLTETITGFVNPKFGAIKDITEMASDVKSGRGVK